VALLSEMSDGEDPMEEAEGAGEGGGEGLTVGMRGAFLAAAGDPPSASSCGDEGKRVCGLMVSAVAALQLVRLCCEAPAAHAHASLDQLVLSLRPMCDANAHLLKEIESSAACMKEMCERA
jgi:hypothetical protein